MKIKNIINQLPWSKSNGVMRKEKISIVVVHHDGDFRSKAYNSLKRYIAEANNHIAKKPISWNHISYHYIIDNVGDIFQCLPETEIGYHAGNLTINKKSIAIKLDGNMETQQPTDKQLKAYKELMVWLTTKRPDLPLVVKSSVRGHRDIKPTACPGKNFYKLIKKF